MMRLFYLILCNLLIFVVSYFKVESLELNSPIILPENEWDINPNVFAEWPKIGMAETKHYVKSPTVSKIFKYLPGTTKPIEYTIQIRVILESERDEEELTAQGSVKISVKCVYPTKTFVMHADVKYLTILENTVKVIETLKGRPISTIPVLNQTYELDSDFYTIHLASACKVSREYLVEIGFVADIATDALTGLYLSTYTDPATNITKRLATTQFEAEWARNMFPNYDDPDYKAIFRMIIGRHKNYTSMSNMNLIKTEMNKELQGWYWDHYAPTPVMSSYLLALVVSDFKCVEAPPPGYKKLVQVCGPPYMIEQGGGVHSAHVVATVLAYYDRFMKQEYPLPKMTSVAIPDFEAGAMENWGLNTYRIKGLIYYPRITSEEDRLRIDLTIAHELAHQNFGNLVTCKFWNQIWLNEGFATYISYYGLRSVSPEYDPDTLWLSGYRRRALQTDANPEIHPLVNISNPMFYFDGISYSKGASLLRMMEKVMTERFFHEALQLYLAKHAYNTATQWDLFEIMDKVAAASGVQPSVASITEIMESWSLQSGYPLIKVEYLSDRVISVTQERFLDINLVTENPNLLKPPTLWYIPITISYNNLPFSASPLHIPQIWLTKTEPSKVIYLEHDFEWVAINHDATAFGRILYDDELAKRLQTQLDTAHETMSAITRAQIIEDAFETAWAGHGKVEQALNFTRYLGKELKPVVWSAALNGLGRIYSMFVEEENELQLLKDYVYDLLTESLERIGIEQGSDENGVHVMHRGSMLHWAGVLEVPKALDYAKSLVQNWVDSSVNIVPPDLHSQTYCNAIIASDRAMYDTLTEFIKQVSDKDLKAALARALGCSKDENVVNELRQNLTNPDLPEDLSYEVLLRLARNTLSRKTLVQYLDENFYEIQEYFESGRVFARSLELAVQYWNKESHLRQVQEFVQKYKDDLSGSVKKKIKEVTEQIKRNILWVQKFAEPIKSWLMQNK